MEEHALQRREGFTPAALGSCRLLSPTTHHMTEKKSGAKLETKVAPTLKKKFERKCKKSNTSMAQQLRDLIQQFVRG